MPKLKADSQINLIAKTMRENCNEEKPGKCPKSMPHSLATCTWCKALYLYNHGCRISKEDEIRPDMSEFMAADWGLGSPIEMEIRK